MAIKLVNYEWCACVEDYRREFICDTDADFENLPPAAVGSIALSVATGNIRVVNASGKWVAFGGTA